MTVRGEHMQHSPRPIVSHLGLASWQLAASESESELPSYKSDADMDLASDGAPIAPWGGAARSSQNDIILSDDDADMVSQIQAHRGVLQREKLAAQEVRAAKRAAATKVKASTANPMAKSKAAANYKKMARASGQASGQEAQEFQGAGGAGSDRGGSGRGR